MSALLYCANIATEKTISGTPQTRQKVVLAKTLLKRCGVVPPPFNVGLAMVMLIQAAIAMKDTPLLPLSFGQLPPACPHTSKFDCCRETGRRAGAVKSHAGVR